MTVPCAARVAFVVDVVSAYADRIPCADRRVVIYDNVDRILQAAQIIFDRDRVTAGSRIIDLFDLLFGNVHRYDDTVFQRVFRLQNKSALNDDRLPQRCGIFRRRYRNAERLDRVDDRKFANIFCRDRRNDQIDRLRFQIAVPYRYRDRSFRHTRNDTQRVHRCNARIADGEPIVRRNVFRIGHFDLQALAHFDLRIVCRCDREIIRFYQRHKRRSVVNKGYILFHCFRFQNTEPGFDRKHAAFRDRVRVQIGLRTRFMDEQTRYSAVYTDAPYVTDLFVRIYERQIRQYRIGVFIVVIPEILRVRRSRVDKEHRIRFAADQIGSRDRFDRDRRQRFIISLRHDSVFRPAHAVARIGNIFRRIVDDIVLIRNLQSCLDDQFVACLRRLSGISRSVEIERDLSAPFIDVRTCVRRTAAHNLHLGQHGNRIRKLTLVVVFQIGRNANFRIAVPVACRQCRRVFNLRSRQAALHPNASGVRPAHRFLYRVDRAFFVGNLQARIDAQHIPFRRRRARIIRPVEIKGQLAVPFINVRASIRLISARDLDFVQHGSIVRQLRLV